MLADGPYLNAGRTVPGKLLNVTSPAPVLSSASCQESFWLAQGIRVHRALPGH